MHIHYYNIAGWAVEIKFQKTDDVTNIGLLPSFIPFRVSKEVFDGLPRLLTLTVDNALRPVAKERRERIRAFDTGNGETVVDHIKDGGYQYIVRNIFGRSCALIITNGDFTECQCALAGDFNQQQFGLNNAMMLIYAFASSYHATLLIHASVVRRGDEAYAFIAKSGTGKSTQVANWLKAIDGCDLLNDDNPIVRILDDGEVRIYGSPWSGKTPCYRNTSARLGAISRIERAGENAMLRQGPLDALASFLPSCSSMKWDKDIYGRLRQSVTAVIERVPIFTLQCLPDEESARVCHKAINEYYGR